jgi:SEC-C motif-containing protein
MSSQQNCYCGSSLPFEQCCQPYIKKDKQPQTPEQLMRSRFSAYACKAHQYIVDTYAQEKRDKLDINEIKQSSKGCHWFALIIHNSDDVSSSTAVNNKYFVEFSAFYIINDTLCEMREKSSFVLEDAKWRYLDGEIINHEELCKVTRNQTCPCNDYPTAWTLSSSAKSALTKKAKKYKQCCGKY